MKISSPALAVVTLTLGLVQVSSAAESSDLNAAYHRAEQVHGGLAAKVKNLSLTPAWDAGSEGFWFRRDDADGASYIAVNPVKHSEKAAFDQPRMAADLSRLTAHSVDAEHLELTDLAVDTSKRLMTFSLDGKNITCHLDDYHCESRAPETVIPYSVASPDGRRVVLTKADNLVLHEVKSGAEHPLTQDGEPHFSYGKMPDAGLLSVLKQSTGMQFSPFGIQWSPDGRHLVVMRVDERSLPEYYFLQSVPYDKTLRPKVLTMRQALSGEPVKAATEMSIIDPATGRKVLIDVGPLGLSPELWWAADGSHFLALQGGDYSRKETLFDVEVATGAVRKVFEEESKTFLQISPLEYDEPAVRFLPRTNEFIWFSQRDGWNHLYLLDVRRGIIKAELGTGPWSIQNIVAVDEAHRVVYFAAVGREKGENPYYRHLYSVRLDGSDLRLLSPGAADHAFPVATNPALRDVFTALGRAPHAPAQMMSPSARYFVDSASTVDAPPKFILRKADGSEVMSLGQADIAAVQDAGWIAPEEVHGIAADGKSDLYGLLIKPAGFDPKRRYPVVECIYNGPQVVTTPHDFEGGLNNWMASCAHSFSQLGFATFVMDGRGTPLRSKAFQDHMYNNMQEFALEDHVAFLKQLAQERPYLDLERLGVIGHSFGGYSSMKAILGYPDFYKAAVSSAGPYNMYGMYSLDAFFEPPNYEGGSWKPDRRPTNWGQVDLTQQASRLKGKLLIAYGDLDENAYPSVTAGMVNALIAANKEFDLIYMPNRSHAFSGESYFIRRSWDFFVRNLLQQEPPKDYQFTSAR